MTAHFHNDPKAKKYIQRLSHEATRTLTMSWDEARDEAELGSAKTTWLCRSCMFLMVYIGYQSCSFHVLLLG